MTFLDHRRDWNPAVAPRATRHAICTGFARIDRALDASPYNRRTGSAVAEDCRCRISGDRAVCLECFTWEARQICPMSAKAPRCERAADKTGGESDSDASWAEGDEHFMSPFLKRRSNR